MPLNPRSDHSHHSFSARRSLRYVIPLAIATALSAGATAEAASAAPLAGALGTSYPAPPLGTGPLGGGQVAGQTSTPVGGDTTGSPAATLPASVAPASVAPASVAPASVAPASVAPAAAPTLSGASLAATGSDPRTLAFAGSSLLIAGVALQLMRRRRRA